MRKYEKVKLTCIEYNSKRQEYYIDTEGNVFSVNIKTGKETLLKKHNNGRGYYTVNIAQGTHAYRTRLYIHRLVAMQFIPNNERKPTVNHIDGNKGNNNVNNLEWASREEQMQHSYYSLKRGTLHKIYCKKINEENVYCFDSIRECSRFLNTDDSKIRYALKHTGCTMGWLFSLNGVFPNMKEIPKQMSRKVYIKDDRTNEIFEFSSATLATKFLNRSLSTLYSAINRGHLVNGFRISFTPFL